MRGWVGGCVDGWVGSSILSTSVCGYFFSTPLVVLLTVTLYIMHYTLLIAIAITINNY